MYPVFKAAGIKTGFQERVSPRHAERRGRRLHSLKCVLPRPFLQMLFVGSERPEEFREALKLATDGHAVLVVNPRETDAAKSFQLAGGKFLRARIEDLSPHCRGFELIREHYPYPSGRHYVPPKAFALARLRRLAPGGRWILYTEANRFATLLKAAVDFDSRFIGRFTAELSRIPFDSAPASHYPATHARFRMIFRRLF
jgi:hypothetical protein